MKQPPPPNFDPVARIYRYAEYLALGPLLQRTRTHFLPQLTLCHRALVLGDGDGRFTAQILTKAEDIRILAVDTSETMLNLLQRRCEQATNRLPVHRLRTIRASALEITPSRDTDLITTHFFLDCLTQPELNTLAQTLAAHTAPGTLWLLSDFGPPHPRLLRPFAALYIRALYLAFRILTGLRVTRLPNPQSALTAAGFDRIARHDLLHGLLYTEIWKHR